MHSNTNYDNQIIINFGFTEDGEPSTLTQVSQNLQTKWQANHLPKYSSQIVSHAEMNTDSMPSIANADNTRIYIVIHGAPGGLLGDDKKNKIPVDEIADKLIGWIGDANVSINLVACSGGRGSDDFTMNDADSAAAALGRAIFEKTNRNIPVIGRTNVVESSPQGKKVLTTNISHVQYVELTPEERQKALKEKHRPNSKFKFITRDNIQYRHNVYYPEFSKKFCRFLSNIECNIEEKIEIKKWVKKLNEKTPEEILTFLKNEYNNKDSIINESRNLFYRILPKLLELQLIINAEAKMQAQSIAEKDTQTGKWKLNNSTNSSTDSTPPDQETLFIPEGITLKEILDFKNNRLLNIIIENKPGVLKTKSDFEIAVNRLHIPSEKLFDSFLKHGKQDELSKALMFLDINILFGTDREKQIEFLKKLNEKNFKFTPDILNKYLNHMRPTDALDAINNKMFPISFQDQSTYRAVVNASTSSGTTNRLFLLAVLKTYQDDRNTNTKEYSIRGAKYFGGVNKKTKLAATKILIAGLENAIKTSQPLTLDLSDNITEADFKKAVGNSRLGAIYRALQKDFGQNNISINSNNSFSIRMR